MRVGTHPLPQAVLTQQPPQLNCVRLLISQNIQAAASDICVPRTLTVAVLRGRVLTEPSQIGIEPLANAVVELHKYSDSGRVVAKVVADKDGRFNFGRVKNGKYMIHVVPPKGLSEFSFPIQFNRSRKAKSVDSEINITIGFGYKGCRGSFAQYGEAKTN